MTVSGQEVGSRLTALKKLYPHMRMSELADRINDEIVGLVPVPYSNGSTPALEIARVRRPVRDNPQA